MSRATIETSGEGEIKVCGELSFATVTSLNKQAAALFGAQGGDLRVDLAGVERADSAGLALLIEWVRWAHQRGVSIHFSHMPVQMQTIAAASDLTPILPLSD